MGFVNHPTTTTATVGAGFIAFGLMLIGLAIGRVFQR